jgi:hypothetical protein
VHLDDELVEWQRIPAAGPKSRNVETGRPFQSGFQPHKWIKAHVMQSMMIMNWPADGLTRRADTIPPQSSREHHGAERQKYEKYHRLGGPQIRRRRQARLLPSANPNAIDPIPRRRRVIALRDSAAWARRAAPAESTTWTQMGVFYTKTGAVSRF